MRISVTNLAGACISAALLAACGGSNALSSSTMPVRTLPAALRHVVYTFQGDPDGANPAASLLAGTNGELFGTTRFGGTGAGFGDGTVFELLPSGDESILYSFQGGDDGQYPAAPLIAIKGALYGETANGGGASFCSYSNGCGTAFELTPSSSGYSERILHVFQGKVDGAYPQAGLTAIDGALYGTAAGGGEGVHVCADSRGCGVVFELAPSSSGYTEKVLYFFKGGAGSGEPLGGVTEVKGTLYGTTWWGGLACSCGAVFKISLSGKERTLYRFKGGTDGARPVAGLININGTLYGTTSQGGASNDGTIFKITTSGTETTLYSFKGGTDGTNPEANLLNVNGALYGSTVLGGGSGCRGGQGCGTIFKVTKSGTETVLYRFEGGTDGAKPIAGLIAENGTLYGATYAGGARARHRYGAIFSMKP
jgi:uncharacterized repeat protein (TIGR03803 family)